MVRKLLDTRAALVVLAFLVALTLLAIRDLCGAILPESGSFSNQYNYYRAESVTQSAEICFQERHFECAIDHYIEARNLLECSHVDDRFLSFRIALGLSLSEAFLDKEAVMRRVLDKVFNKFASNPSRDKINFDTLGGTHVCKSFPEAQ